VLLVSFVAKLLNLPAGCVHGIRQSLCAETPRVRNSLSL
jgi:hypothetical protein